VALKKKFGEAVGVDVRVMEYDKEITEEELAEQVQRLSDDSGIHGVVVQLPLPKHISAEKILNLVPVRKDVDALNADASVLSPVVGAIKEIFERNNVDLNNKKIVIVGKGKLVGMPTAIWLAQEGYEVEMLDKKNSNLQSELKEMDVIISGAGVPGLITPDMLKPGAVLIDAGTTESAGKLAGDADPACADKCSLFTPVPGGVGSVTVAVIFKNLSSLS
jgi:methylenetetrahydrofolate dehydrogenase (NADP+)/methenyltetrahydrofolate cyclohydrolase